ncbi:MAG: ferrous iron transporter B [Candidatus Korarchaeota archaeon]|nr:ferrous iron transporter B [Candidatus Korarchaeota archaeon]NIU81922.1 GTP-binding protein [Candidatus Thorarchaeota archaeon]NIW12380.1 GTP-binding protein [Candidatus Thorarchaeota archaeon]NIW51172.1 GTP-binding protein [Candidatus Korarchaeota archaeon]
MRKLLLMGNPNVGKSVIFSRLTGVDVTISNFPGTTVDYKKGGMVLDGEQVEVIDVPGTYSLTPIGKAEEVAVKLLQEGDIVVNVVDATNLERNLYLTLEILERQIPVIVVLNMWDEARQQGIRIDTEKLETLLNVPVVPTVARTGEGIHGLVSRLNEARNVGRSSLSEDERWETVEAIAKQVETEQPTPPQLKERISEVTVKPKTGIPIAIAVIMGTFWCVRFIGESLIGYLFEPLFNVYEPFVINLSDFLGHSGILHDILIGELINGEIVWVESMGVLTTGLFVPFGMVLPYIISFYVMLSFLEDVGYLPRLATLMDSFFHKLGIPGHGIVTVFLGLGCNVPGALSTRMFETHKQRFIAATLMGIGVPCMAQIAMIFGVLGTYGLTPILLVFLILFVTYVTVGLLLNLFLKGQTPEILIELPPYRTPSMRAVLKKVWMRIRQFLKDALPWLFLGVVLINLSYSFGVIQILGRITALFMESWFGLPGESSLALLIGFLRKDMAVGMLLTLNVNLPQLVIAVTILVIYFPCVATFVVLLKEFGLKGMFKSSMIMVIVALLVGGILRILLLSM